MIGEGEQLTQLKTWVSLPGPLSGAVFFFCEKDATMQHTSKSSERQVGLSCIFTDIYRA